jgi:1,3-beta-glucanosyltransferase GAS1
MGKTALTTLQGDTPSWTQNQSDAYRAVVDSFSQYDNTAGFFVGNEVLNGRMP